MPWINESEEKIMGIKHFYREVGLATLNDKLYDLNVGDMFYLDGELCLFSKEAIGCSDCLFFTDCGPITRCRYTKYKE